MGVAVPKDDWTPAKLKTHREWRSRMYAPANPAPRPDALAAKMEVLANPERAALESRMRGLEEMISKLREDLAAARRAKALIRHDELPLVANVIRIEQIIRVVAKYFNYSASDLKSARRIVPLCRARHIAVYLCKELTLRSFPEIARHVGGRDHTTAMHSCRKVSKWRLTDSVMCQEIAELEAMFA